MKEMSAHLRRWRGPVALAGAVAFVWLLIWVSPMDGRRVLSDAVRTATGTNTAVFALAAIGLNVHFGYTGLLNFGHVGFMLVGGYGYAVTVATFGGSMWLGIAVGIFLAVLLALVLGGPTLRLRADYLAIVTIASSEILRFVVRSRMAQEVTGGVFGLTRYTDRFHELNPLPVGRYGFWIINYTQRRLWPVVVGWSLVVIAALFVFLLMRSPWGRVMRAVREDEDAARSVGKNAYWYKMQSLLLGGVIGGAAGILWVIHLGSIDPDQFLPIVTFFTYAIVILGGPASVLGPIVGAILFWFFVQGFDSFIRQASTAGYVPAFLGGSEAAGALRFTIVGLGLMLLMIYRPQGMLGNRREMQLDVR